MRFEDEKKNSWISSNVMLPTPDGNDEGGEEDFSKSSTVAATQSKFYNFSNQSSLMRRLILVGSPLGRKVEIDRENCH